MTDTTGRNAERTRRAVLDAAIALLNERGTSVSLADVAERAGVSKGGLMHHFPSREALFNALAIDVLDRFRAAVNAHLDLSENTPGKLLRAYVRTLCGGAPDVMREFSASPIWNTLTHNPEIATAMSEDNELWRTDLSADGIDATHVAIVRRAAEGLAAAYSYGDEDDTSLHAAREALLAMTYTT